MEYGQWNMALPILILGGYCPPSASPATPKYRHSYFKIINNFATAIEEMQTINRTDEPVRCCQYAYSEKVEVSPTTQYQFHHCQQHLITERLFSPASATMTRH